VTCIEPTCFTHYEGLFVYLYSDSDEVIWGSICEAIKYIDKV
jgi:hypothetical protein